MGTVLIINIFLATVLGEVGCDSSEVISTHMRRSWSGWSGFGWTAFFGDLMKFIIDIFKKLHVCFARAYCGSWARLLTKSLLCRWYRDLNFCVFLTKKKKCYFPT